MECGCHFVEGHGVDVEGSKDRLLVRHAGVVHVGDLRSKDFWRTFSILFDNTSIEITHSRLKQKYFFSNPRKILKIIFVKNGEKHKKRRKIWMFQKLLSQTLAFEMEEL